MVKSLVHLFKHGMCVWVRFVPLRKYSSVLLSLLVCRHHRAGARHLNQSKSSSTEPGLILPAFRFSAYTSGVSTAYEPLESSTKLRLSWSIKSE